jgi:hypothetical protein
MQRLDYQPAAKSIPITMQVPISTQVQKQQPVPAIATAPDTDIMENCQDFQQCLHALAEKYSLDSFTIATSDGLVFASSGGGTAQEDAASYSRSDDVSEPAGITLFSVNHKDSKLTGIIRSQSIITEETQKRIENDTKDILNRWI